MWQSAKRPAELALLNDEIDAIDFVKSESSLQVDQVNEGHKSQHENEAPRSSFYQTPNWQINKLLPIQGPLYLEAAYAKYRDFSPAKLF